jgi:hypothetical protein
MKSWEELEKILNMIRHDVTCPSCHSHYKKNGINIMGQMGGTLFLNMKCDVCGSSAFLNVVTPEQKRIARAAGENKKKGSSSEVQKIPEGYEKTIEGMINESGQKLSDMMDRH